MYILTKNKLPIATIIAAIILRFYNIGPLTIFLSDQGRDAIIVKRIITFEHWPAIGPPTSIGHVFLGPFYYYFIAPFLWISGLNPVGMAVGVAILSIIGLVISYLIIRKEYNKVLSDIFLILATFSFINIDYSRFSWNPNPLPYFSFITLYLAAKTFETKKILFGFLLGSMLALSVQLHYLAILLAIPMALVGGYKFFRDTKKVKFLISITSAIAGFIVFSAPLIIFDLKHQFINSKSLIALLQKERIVSNSSFFWRFQDTTRSFINHTFQIDIPHNIALVVLLVFLGIAAWLIRKKMKTLDLLQLGAIFFYLLGFGLLQSHRHPHYYMSIYFSLFLVLSLLLYSIHNKKLLSKMIIIIVISIYIGLNAKHYYYFTREPNNQIKHAQNVANFLASKINNKPYNIATWPIEFTEDPYLYFLESKGLKAANRERIEITDQMFVLCNTTTCSIIDSPSWNINMFGKAKIAERWEIERIKIFKLEHDI